MLEYHYVVMTTYLWRHRKCRLSVAAVSGVKKGNNLAMSGNNFKKLNRTFSIFGI